MNLLKTSLVSTLIVLFLACNTPIDPPLVPSPGPTASASPSASPTPPVVAGPATIKVKNTCNGTLTIGLFSSVPASNGSALKSITLAKDGSDSFTVDSGKDYYLAYSQNTPTYWNVL